MWSDLCKRMIFSATPLDGHSYTVPVERDVQIINCATRSQAVMALNGYWNTDRSAGVHYAWSSASTVARTTRAVSETPSLRMRCTACTTCCRADTTTSRTAKWLSVRRWSALRCGSIFIISGCKWREAPVYTTYASKSQCQMDAFFHSFTCLHL